MNQPAIRPARADDQPAIAAFTADTFSWGDYVAEAFDGWLRHPDALVAVATVEDMPVAVARGVMMSPTEGWMHGARVHPDHRRKGLATRLNHYLCDWAFDRGAQVVRLMIESWNEPAQRQVEAAGYRKVCEWVNGVYVFSSQPDPAANGGRRVPGDEQLAVGTPAEIDPAWVAWSSSDLARAGRGLFPRGWLMRRMNQGDLVTAVQAKQLLHGPSGWVIAEPEGDDTMFVPWFVATEDDGYRLARAVVDRADRRGFPRIRMLVPSLPWVSEALGRAGFDLSDDQIWARSRT
ncbi:MAG: N-acetyltransferase family protein [Acidimicrobiia bacterium]